MTHNLSIPESEFLQEVESLLTQRWITDLANTSALIMQRALDINWVGFYLLQNDSPETLWLGPFQGLPACTMIPLNKGVCGAAATQKKSIKVDDVDAFPNHIVCDSRSKSELVIPMIKNNELIGVLDIDSVSLSRFSEGDQILFEKVVAIILKNYVN